MKQNSVCPKCSSQVVARLHRSLLEKILSRKKKYRCAHCKNEFFLKTTSRG